MGIGLDRGQGLDGDDSSTGLDDAFVDADVESIQALPTQRVDSMLELSEAGRVRSDFVNDSRYKPY